MYTLKDTSKGRTKKKTKNNPCQMLLSALIYIRNQHVIELTVMIVPICQQLAVTTVSTSISHPLFCM